MMIETGNKNLNLVCKALEDNLQDVHRKWTIEQVRDERTRTRIERTRMRMNTKFFHPWNRSLQYSRENCLNTN